MNTHTCSFLNTVPKYKHVNINLINTCTKTDVISMHMLIYTYIYIYMYIYSLRKSDNYLLKSAQYNSVIILWEKDDAK